jgi:rhamnose transport system substrate-binding protein
VTWDSPIPSGRGETVFVAQVDFAETGVSWPTWPCRSWARNGGEFAILSAAPDCAEPERLDRLHGGGAGHRPKYANLTLVETVYGNDQSEESYNRALARSWTATRTSS